MSKFKSAAAVLAIATSASAFAITPVITLTDGSGSFAGSAETNTFKLDLSDYVVTDLTALVTANYLGAGYNVTGATFDGISFSPQANVSTPSGGFDYWTYQATSVTSTEHEIIIYGNAIGGSTAGFTGSVSVANAPIVPPPLPAVPEPETYAMLLAGLGLLGVVARRRTMKS